MDSTVPIMRHRSAPQSGARDDRDSDGPLMGSPSTVQMGSAFNYNNNTRSSNSFRNQYDGTSPYKFRNHSRPTSKISAFFAAGYGDGDDGDQSQRWKNLLALAVGFLLLVAPWMRHVQVQWKVRTLQTDLEQLQHQQRQLQKEVRNQITTLQTIKTDAADYKQRNDELLGNLKARGDEYDDFDAAAYREAEEMEERYFKRVDELEREIQRAGARQLVHAGHGVLGSSAPVRAVVTLAAPPATTTTTTEGDGGDDSVRSRQQLVLELAPAHTYSHAVAYFWDMVQRRRVYDRWTLMRSAGNGGGSVLYTVPMDYGTKRMNDFDGTMGHFEMSREDGSVRNDGAAVLDKLAVLEHPQVESDYPIEKYSVLFSDHGPNFYIVLSDKINELEVNRDEVCFAKVIEGREILDSIIADDDHRRHTMLGIESVRMMVAVEENNAANRWLPLSQRTINYRVVEE